MVYGLQAFHSGQIYICKSCMSEYRITQACLVQVGSSGWFEGIVLPYLSRHPTHLFFCNRGIHMGTSCMYCAYSWPKRASSSLSS